jgi:ribonuclease HII
VFFLNLSKLSVAEIKKLFKGPREDWQEHLPALADDPRAGVREIYRRLKRAEAVLDSERKRLAKMYLYEEDLRAAGYELVAGVDEAGRGPLAGPVVAAAVIVPPQAGLPYLNDSKKLTAKKREELAVLIKKTALGWATGMSTVEEILQQNIHQAGLVAMRRAVQDLPGKPTYLLVDGFKITGLDLPQTPLIGGDGLSASIAAASILAKVTRDQLMDSYDRLYPEYGFRRHKGYATPEHLQALKRFGPCPIHRAGFQPVRDMLEII